MKDSIFDLVALVMLFLAATTLYYVFILAPRDAVLYEVMECMGSDNSQDAYDDCHKKLNPHATPD